MNEQQIDRERLAEWRDQTARIVEKYGNEAWAEIHANEVVAIIDALTQAEATLAAIKARDEEVSTDEGWWIGGAWGDYGEVVVPLRILSYVIDGNLDQKVTETSPDYALTYAEQVARADQAEARIQAVRDALDNPPGSPGGDWVLASALTRAIRRALEGEA